MANSGPERGTLIFDSTATGDEDDNRYRLAMHILYNMDTNDATGNTQNDGVGKEWVNTVANYKKYVADYNNDGKIDGKDLSNLCSDPNFDNSEDIKKPWLPVISSNQTTISANQDTKITLTFSNYGDIANTTLEGGEAKYFDIIDNSGNEVDDAIKGFAIDSNKVILTLKNDVDWSTSTDTYKVRHTTNKAEVTAPVLMFANSYTNDTIYDFEASSFTLTDTLAPTVTISKAFNGTHNTDAKINTKDNLQILFTFSRSIDSFDILDITFNSAIDFTNATLALNNDKDVATLSGIPALTDGTYTFGVNIGKFTSVSGVVNTTASNNLEFTFDTTPPTIVSGEVNADGDELILTMSENVEVTGDATADFTIGTQNPSSVTANGNKLKLALTTAITAGERPNIAYDGTNERVKDEAGNAMASRATQKIDVANWTNNSTQTIVYNLTFGNSTVNIFQYDGSNGKLTVEAWDGNIGVESTAMQFILDVPITVSSTPANFTAIENDISTAGYNTYDGQGRDFATGYFKNNDIVGLNAAMGTIRQLQFGGGTTPTSGALFPSPPSVGEVLALISTADTGGTFWKPSKTGLQDLWDNSSLKIILTDKDSLDLSKTSNSVTFKFVNISA